MKTLARIFLIIMAFSCILNAGTATENINCPICKYIDHASASDKDEACLPSEYNEDHPDLATTSCEVADDKVGKCVSFAGNLTVNVVNVGNQTVAVYYRSCLVKDSDPGNVCEDLSGIFDGEPEFLVGILSWLNFL
ncbi:uncharacterized protein [Ptychodera flava]|uniref:uncharacterized protein n=1 Tax=Ptychodera flava TaxID=63121 RepID=UPI003969FE50